MRSEFVTPTGGRVREETSESGGETGEELEGAGFACFE